MSKPSETSSIRRKTIEGLRIGESFTVSRTFTEEDVTRFADLTRDYNPVHFDERFSGAKNLKGRICHGLLVGSMLSEIGGQIGWLATEMSFQFKKPVYFGDTVQCLFTITEIGGRGRAVAKVEYRNQRGELVLEAMLKGILPGPEEKKLWNPWSPKGTQSTK